MKLVEILARELNEWPPKADWTVFVISTRGEARASFGCGGKPKPDPSDRKFHTWSVCETETNANWLGVHTVLSEKASDQLTAIVTRSDWEAERAKLKAPKANRDGWIRHRGGKCPVGARGIHIDIRRRNGMILENVSPQGIWEHAGDELDVMAWRAHKPAEQPVNQVDPGVVVFDDQIFVTTRNDTEFPFKPAVNPIEWRDRIRELDTQRVEVESDYQRQISEITQERESLVQRLAGEGLALVEVVMQPVEDMSDWRNWKAGDLVKLADKVCEETGMEPGSIGSISEFDYNDRRGHNVKVDGWYWPITENLTWVSRPAS